MLIKIFSISILIVCVSSEKFRFDNYTLYKVEPNSLEQIKVLRELQNAVNEYDFWHDVTHISKYVNILSKPELRPKLETTLNNAGIDYIVTLENIQDVIDKETKKSYTRSSLRSMQWDAYYTMDDINAWLDDLVAAYPSVASIIIGGRSHEGRDIKGIKISHGPGRKAVFIESGLHAREWITIATTNFITNELLTSNDKEIKAIAHDYDWYIFPVTNPDGYIWSHVGFRMWRKNRTPYGDEYGVDLNRNWNDNNWLKESASTNPASNNFAGLGPFSEMESRTLSTYMINMADRMDLYLSMHSAGQILLVPYGNTTDHLANYHDVMNIGRRAMGALSVRYGTQYTSGNIAEAIYFATGTTLDWVKEHLKVPLCYCYELRDRGTYGHLLPPDQILPTSEEVMDSIVELILQAKRFGYMNYNSASVTKVSMLLIFGMVINIVL